MGWSIALTCISKCLTIAKSSLAIMKYIVRISNLKQSQKKTKKKKTQNFNFSFSGIQRQ